MPNSRVPQAIVDFHLYVNNALDYLNTGTPKNSERLTVTEDELTLLTGIVTRWNPLYILYSDKEKTRTTVVIAQLQDLITEFNDLNQSKHLLNRIAASANVTVVDLKTFNIKSGSTKRSVAVQPIQVGVDVSIQLLGGGSVTIKCREDGSSSASIIDEADCVQYAYIVGKQLRPNRPMLLVLIGMSVQGLLLHFLLARESLPNLCTFTYVGIILNIPNWQDPGLV